MLLLLLLMVASLLLVFLGLATEITMHTRGTSPTTHMVFTYAGLLVTLLSHLAAVLYIIGLRNLLLTPPPADEDEADTNTAIDT